jgi:hypothetical protein
MPTGLAETIHFNHEWTRINTNGNRNQMHGFGRSRDSPSGANNPPKLVFSPYSCLFVPIRGFFQLHGSGLADNGAMAALHINVGSIHYGSYASEHAAPTPGASNRGGEGGYRGEKKLIFSKSAVGNGLVNKSKPLAALALGMISINKILQN